MGALIRRLTPVVRARARRALARRGLAQTDEGDLVQEVWLFLLKDGGQPLRGFDPDRGATLEGFVGMIASREVGNRLRERDAKKRGGDLQQTSASPEELPIAQGGQGTPESDVETSDLAAKLGDHLMQTLPPRGQLIFRYAFTDGLPAPEVAKALRVEVQVVYNWLHKIRRLARDFIEEQRDRTPPGMSPTPS